MSPRWEHKPIDPKLKLAIETLAAERKKLDADQEKLREQLYDLLAIAVEEGVSQTELAKLAGLRRNNLRLAMERRGTLTPRRHYSANRNRKERKGK